MPYTRAARVAASWCFARRARAGCVLRTGIVPGLSLVSDGASPRGRRRQLRSTRGVEAGGHGRSSLSGDPGGDGGLPPAPQRAARGRSGRESRAGDQSRQRRRQPSAWAAQRGDGRRCERTRRHRTGADVPAGRDHVSRACHSRVGTDGRHHTAVHAGPALHPQRRARESDRLADESPRSEP